MNIVVVDDDPLLRLILTKMVVSLGHTAFAAETAEAALALVEIEKIDVVVSDWMMPGRDGLELCRLIRARDTVEYVYFILVTSLDRREHAMTALAGGVDDCLIKPLSPFDLRLRLIAAERVTTLHRRLADQQQDLERAAHEAAASARSDSLTGLGNRRKMDEDLQVFRSRRDRYQQDFGVALLDLDHFKALNDTAGHQAGDQALRQVAEVVRRELREADMAYRYGGEELLVVLPRRAPQVLAAVERIRTAVEAAGIAHPGRPGPGSVLTLSAGVAAGEGEPASFLTAADAALYRAKSSGRNCVAVDSDDSPTP